MRRGLLAGLGLLALAGGIAAFLLRTGGPAARSGAEESAPEAAERPPAPVAGLAAPAAGEPRATPPLPREPPPETSATPKIRGLVVDSEGRPVRPVEVREHTERIPVGGRTFLQSGARRGTDAEGRFELEKLPEVVRWLEVDGRPEHEVRVVKVEAGAREVRIVLERRRLVTITVLDPEGRPQKNALATVWPTPSEAVPFEPFKAPGSDWTSYLGRPLRGGGEATTDRAGVARVWTDAGPAVAGATPPRDAEALPAKGIPVTGDSVVIRLDPAFEVTGTAVDREGKPVPGAHVAWRLRGGAWNSEQVEDDGQFRLLRLPKGVLEVRAQLDPAPPDPDGPGVETPTGRQGLALTVDFGADLRVRVEGSAPGAGVYVNLLARPATVARSNHRLAATSPEGETTLRGLRRDAAYVLQAVSGDGKRTGTWRGSLPADGRAVIRLVEAGTLRLLFDAPGSVAVTAVDVDGVPATYTYAPPPHEELLLSLVPHGAARVTVSARTLKEPTTLLRGSADAQVPGTVRVRLEPVPEEESR